MTRISIPKDKLKTLLEGIRLALEQPADKEALSTGKSSLGVLYDFLLSTEMEETAKRHEEGMVLNEKEKLEILAKFKSWSGGFGPDECERSLITVFLDYSLDIKYQNRRAKVAQFLVSGGSPEIGGLPVEGHSD